MSNGSLVPAISTVQREMGEVEQYAHRMVQTAADLVVNDDKTYEFANQIVVDMSGRIKSVKEKMDFFTKPIKQHVKVIDGFFKTILDPLKQADELIRAKIVRYRMEQQELAEVLADGNQQGAITIPAAAEQKSTRVNGGQMVFSTVWDFEITDADQIETGVLREVVNTARGREALESVIRAHVKAGRRSMPGVRIFKSEQPSVRQ